MVKPTNILNTHTIQKILFCVLLTVFFCHPLQAKETKDKVVTFTVSTTDTVNLQNIFDLKTQYSDITWLSHKNKSVQQDNGVKTEWIKLEISNHTDKPQKRLFELATSKIKTMPLFCFNKTSSCNRAPAINVAEPRKSNN